MSSLPAHMPTSTNPFIGGTADSDSSATSSTSPVLSHGSGGLTASPSCIPPTHPVRTLVLCFDGTGDQFDADNSNIVQFFSMLKKDDRRQQMVYYQAGIGTYTTPQIATPIMAKLSKTLDVMIAWNLDAHVIGGYEFLMQNYESGDKICIFGFSRGAYTARALAGMVHKVGILPACNFQQVPFAYKMFTRTSAAGWAQSTLFKKAFSMDVDIEFVGVWDTVCSVGLIPRHLPFTTSNTCIKTFRHAASLDERRAKFKANLFNWPREDEKQLGTHVGDMPKAGRDEDMGMFSAPIGGLAEPTDGEPSKLVESNAVLGLSIKKGEEQRISLLSRLSNMSKNPKEKSERQKQKEMEREFNQQESQLETDVMEVWFSGCHCDIGGGSVPNATRHSLARIPLRWMIRQCFLTNTGIRFHVELLRGIGMDPAALYPVVQERPEALYLTPSLQIPDVAAPGAEPLTEEEEDLADALSPIYDQLLLHKGWWPLEVFPIRHRIQTDDDTWISKITMNLGQGRTIPKQKSHGVYVHRSVKIRMEGEALKGRQYKPRAKFEVEPTWVA